MYTSLSLFFLTYKATILFYTTFWKKLNSALIFSIDKTLKKDIFPHNYEDRTPLLKTTNCIYQIPCKDCNSSYIGQTKRHLCTRISEHEKSVKDNLINTGLLSHATKNKHNFNFNEAKILNTDINDYKRNTWKWFAYKKISETRLILTAT